MIAFSIVLRFRPLIFSVSRASSEHPPDAGHSDEGDKGAEARFGRGILQPHLERLKQL